MSKPVLTIREVAKILGVHEKTLYGWCQSHQIEHVRIGTGRHIRFRQQDVDSYLERLAVPAR